MNAENKKTRAARVALPILALTAFWLLTLGPLIQPGQMTCSHDGVLHLLRAFQLDTLLQQGLLWPRWSPGMVLGYGYPLFNFYPVLSLYPVLILYRLGLSLLQSWNLALALSMLASGLTMFLWARRVVGQRGAFVAAVAFMLSPYQLYDVYWRGTLAESLTLPLLPLGLWAALRVAQERRWSYAVAGALAYAAILLTHTSASLIFSFVLLSYMLALLWSAADRRALVFQFAGMLLLGCGLAAFFLIPAFVESSLVQLWRAITLSEGNFRANFLTWSELVGPAQASDPLLINPPPMARSLGWAACALAIIGVIATWWSRRQVSDTHTRHVAWAILSLAGTIVMMLPMSEPIWSHVPLLPFIQFPLRWLGMASLLASLLIGAGVAALQSSFSGLGHPAVPGLCAVVLTIGMTPWAYPRMCSMPDSPNQAFFVAFEEKTGFIGTTTFGEYLPTTVQEIPTTSPMVESMRAGRPVSRWDAPGARVIQARDNGLAAELILESDAPVQVAYRAFYFPGWQASLDGQPANLRVVPPLGLMAIDVPAGRHTLTIRFGSTPLRAISEIVSFITALVVAAIAVHDLRSMRKRGIASPVRSVLLAPRSTEWLGLAVLGVALLVFKTGIVDRYDTLLRGRRLQEGQFKGATHALHAIVAERARLLGYDARPERVASGEMALVDLYWTLDQPLNFLATARLLDERGVEWSSRRKADKALFKGYNSPPSSQEWPIGAYADDRQAVRVLPGAPPGDYFLVAVPFDPDTLQPLPISAGQPAPGNYPGVTVGKLQLVSPARPPSADALDLAVRADAPVGADLTLIGYSQDRDEASPGQAMLLTLGWQARRKPQSDYTLRLELLAPDGRVVLQVFLPPGGDRYPTLRWSAGEVIRSQALVRVPGRAASGQYTWRVTLLDGNTLVGQVNLGRLQVNAPQHVLIAPTMPHRANVQLGDWVALVGFDAPERVAPGQPLQVTLVWQALGETERDYKVFVHLLAADTRPVAQSDAAPAGWMRPTSGWQVGEFVMDMHTLDLKPDLPPGEYRLVVGMYDAATSQRLPVAIGGDVIELGHVSVTKKE